MKRLQPSTLWVHRVQILDISRWLKKDGHLYYLKSSGYRAVSQFAKNSKGYRYLNSKGRVIYDKWITHNGYRYYIKSSGYRAESQWISLKAGKRWVDSKGRVAKNKWVKIKGNTYYFNSKGYMAKSRWVKNDNGKRYVDEKGRMYHSKWTKMDGHWYYFQSDGYIYAKPYVFISIGSQYLHYYSKGKLVMSTPIVSGRLYPKSHDTPRGTFHLNGKAKEVHLIGMEDDGVTEYDSFVYYWMPFKGHVFGIHDATWRGAFGGDIYKYNGSHGCVNLPLGSAKRLYELISVGTLIRIQ